MEFERITRADHPDFDRAFALYEKSFPIHEQRTREKQEGVLSHPEYHSEVITDQGRFVGILLFWEYPQGRYVEHFAIDPDLRGQSYGSRTLEALAQRGAPIVLEIDPPVDPVSVRRQHFYEKLGFVSNPFPHVHPPYRPGFRGHDLVVMTFPRTWEEEEYAAFAGYLGNTVMDDCRDARSAP